MKLGIIRCEQTADVCPGTKDFRAVYDKSGALEDVEEDITVIGFVSCGGCPGKKAVFRALEMIRRGADAIMFASCIAKGTPINFPCPFAKTMIEKVNSAGGGNIKVFDYSHK
jgi:predicted metal-binding protein